MLPPQLPCKRLIVTDTRKGVDQIDEDLLPSIALGRLRAGAYPFDGSTSIAKFQSQKRSLMAGKPGGHPTITM
ncbi:hypothetical protein KSF_031390 [Reticulibacter mediterranei]|uniref:Uncharacterized protein n=1 Tax=Reticulibacter mediterranei TaxID=2778369 RepID=A0A8J3IMS1_9CHLR|nr:hypothetical protein KSF_031390 [Reticulibacter mediterranei]